MGLYRKHGWVMVVLAWLASSGSIQAKTIFIDGSQTNQIIEGFGANLNYDSWNDDDLKPAIDALVDDAHMTLFRVVFDNTDWEDPNDNGDSSVMNWSYYNPIYSSASFQQLWGLIGYLNQKGISNGICLNFQGGGPSWMISNGHLAAGYEDEWAEMITSLLYYARNTAHLQFNLVAPDNEPDGPPQGIAITGSAQYVTMLHDLAVKLDANGLGDIQFVAPDLSTTSTSFMNALTADPVIMAKLAHYGVHSYTTNGGGSVGVADFIQQSSYPDITFWMTEFNVFCSQCEAGHYGTYDWPYCKGTAQYLLSHLTNGASAGMVWEGYDSVYYILGQRWSLWGLLAVDNTNAAVRTYTPRKHFYTLSQISRFVLPGAYSIDLTGNSAPFAQLLAFWHPDNQQLAIVGVNTSGNASTLTAAIVALPIMPNLELYYTDQSSNLVHLSTVPITNGTNFTATIPANCVFTLVGSVPTPPPPILQTSLTNNGIVISWSGALTNYTLEATDDIASPYDWTPVTNQPQSAGTNQQVIITPTADQQFFRLHQQ